MSKDKVYKSFVAEAQFQEWLRQLVALPIYGYVYYHTHRSIASPAGFPDTVLIRLEPAPRLIFIELKTDDFENSQPSIDQWLWLYMLQQIGEPVEAYLFRVSDRDEIEEVLK